MIKEYITNLFNIYLLILILLVCVKQSIEICDTRELFYIGRTASCEAAPSESGASTSCFGTPFPVKKAVIQCAEFYHSALNISLQTVECDGRRWSPNIMNCYPECDDTIPTFQLITNTTKKYPSWYAEIVEINPNTSKTRVFPGIILLERNVLTKEEHWNDTIGDGDTVNLENFLVRIPGRKNLETKLYNILSVYFASFEDFKIPVANTTYDQLRVVNLDRSDYIKFNKKVKPACEMTYPKGFSKHSKILITRSDYFLHRTLPLPNENCFVPIIDNTKLEIACLENQGDYYHMNLTDCQARNFCIIKRCKIGYQQKRNTTLDYLSDCFIFSIWDDYNVKDNGCDLVCGKMEENDESKLSTRIYEGSKSIRGFAPWHVAIYRNDTTKSKTIQQICGGTIIHHNTVISAAHCFYNIKTGGLNKASDYIVGAGKYFRKYEISEESEHYANVKEIHIPKNYEQFPVRNDIAVLILDHYIEYTYNIKPACIDFNPTTITGGLEGLIVGWGSTSSNDTFENELMTANFKTITNDECKSLVGPDHKSEITNDKFCATSDINSTACAGDSGGGFVIRKKYGRDYRYFLIGIVSIGVNPEKYCSNGFTTVFTNLKLYNEMIKKITSDSRSLHYADMVAKGVGELIEKDSKNFNKTLS